MEVIENTEPGMDIQMDYFKLNFKVRKPQWSFIRFILWFSLFFVYVALRMWLKCSTVCLQLNECARCGSMTIIYERFFFLVMYMEFRSCHSKYIRIKFNQILIDRANNHLMLSLLFLSLRTHSLHLSFECSAMCQIDFSLEYELDLRFSLQCELCWR